MNIARVVLLVQSVYAYTSWPIRQRYAVRMTIETAGERVQTQALDSLSRLASKMSNVKIDTINRIVVSSVGEDFLELEVVSCDDDKCVSLLVPLQFPTRCDPNSADFDDCVLSNVYKLDESIVEITEKEERRTSIEDPTKTSARYEIRVAKEDRMKPEWLSKPSGEMKTACADVKKILNSNSFETDLLTLASALIPYQGARVLAARVDTIGTNGMLLTALTDDQGPLSLEFSFPSTVDTPKQLHEVVLGAVAQAQQQLQQLHVQHY